MSSSDRPKRNGNGRGKAFARKIPRLTQHPVRKCFALPNNPNVINLLHHIHPKSMGWGLGVEIAGAIAGVEGEAFADKSIGGSDWLVVQMLGCGLGWMGRSLEVQGKAFAAGRVGEAFR